MLGPEECCWGVKRNPTREHQKGNEANSVLIFLLLLLLLLILFAILILILLSALLTALSSGPVDWESLLPDVWIAAHPEHFLTFRRDEAEAAAIARRRRRERRRAKAPEHSRSP
jgi:hypothetical protein